MFGPWPLLICFYLDAIPVFNRLPFVVTLCPDVDFRVAARLALVLDGHPRVACGSPEPSNDTPITLFVACPVGWIIVEVHDVVILTVHSPLDPDRVLVVPMTGRVLNRKCG